MFSFGCRSLRTEVTLSRMECEFYNIASFYLLHSFNKCMEQHRRHSRHPTAITVAAAVVIAIVDIAIAATCLAGGPRGF